MFSSRATSSRLTRHDGLQSAQKIFRRSYANSKSKNHRRQGRGPPKAKDVRDAKKSDREYRQDMFKFARVERNNIYRVKDQRREDWELGPLKPWRAAVGAKPTYSDKEGQEGRDEIDDFFGNGNSRYGNIPMTHMNSIPEVPVHRRIKQWLFRVGDRVCLVEGRRGERGKIGTIRRIDYGTERVTVKGINVMDVGRPDFATERDDPGFDTTEMPIPFRALRLVYPLCDPKTKEYRDCILNDLEVREGPVDHYLSFDPERKKTFDRYLVPQNMRIPWPDEQENNYQEYKDDTKRLLVEAKTFMPTLLRPPMPEGAIDELSKFKPTISIPPKVTVGRWDRVQENEREFGEIMKEEFDVDHIEKKRQKEEFEAMKKETKQKLLAKPGRNIARGGRSANGEFMRNKELPQFDEATLQVIARHMQAAQSKKAQGANTSIPPQPPTSGSEGPRARI